MRSAIIISAAILLIVLGSVQSACNVSCNGCIVNSVESQTACQACATDYFFKDGTTEGALKGLCYVATTAGYWKDGTTATALMKACTAGCATCVNGTTCTTCNTAFSFKDGTAEGADKGICYTNALAGFWKDGAVLKACEATCATCINATTCTTCAAGKFWVKDSKIDTVLCASTCEASCATCINVTTCTTCKTGKYFKFTNTAINTVLCTETVAPTTASASTLVASMIGLVMTLFLF